MVALGVLAAEQLDGGLAEVVDLVENRGSCLRVQQVRRLDAPLVRQRVEAVAGSPSHRPPKSHTHKKTFICKKRIVCFALIFGFQTRRWLWIRLWTNGKKPILRAGGLREMPQKGRAGLFVCGAGGGASLFVLQATREQKKGKWPKWSEWPTPPPHTRGKV